MLDKTKTVSSCSFLWGNPSIPVESLRGSLCGSSADLKDEEEDVYNVNVEGQSSVDVFFWADGQLPIPDEELSVVH